jgi:hypothetical protein
MAQWIATVVPEIEAKGLPFVFQLELHSNEALQGLYASKLNVTAPQTSIV